MANASSKKTAQSNATLLQTLLLAPFIAGVLHLPLRWLIRSRAWFSWASFVFLVLVAGQVFAWRFLKLNAGVRRDQRGMMKSAGVDLASAGGIIEVLQDFIYLSSFLNVAAPILSFKLYWALILVPGVGGYKLYQFAKPFIAQRMQQASRQADGPVGGANRGTPAEPASKRQAKMQKKQEKMERMQTGGRGARR